MNFLKRLILSETEIKSIENYDILLKAKVELEREKYDLQCTNNTLKEKVKNDIKTVDTLTDKIETFLKDGIVITGTTAIKTKDVIKDYIKQTKFLQSRIKFD